METNDRHAQMDVPADRAGPAAARRFVADAVARWGLAIDVDVVTLLASEVVTNAVLHGTGPVQVFVARRSHGVRVEVRDNGDGRPELGAPRTDAAGGRGLFLVDSLAAGWGVERAECPAGKVVWFDVPEVKAETAGVGGRSANG